LRDRLLAASEETDRIAWLVEVGRFVEDRWLAEEQARRPGEALDEDELWDLWDECSEKYLRDLRTEARELLREELRKRRARAFASERLSAIEPISAVASGIAWVFGQMFRAVVGAIGVVAFGLLLVTLYPRLVQSIHSTFDRAFPPPHAEADDHGSGSARDAEPRQENALKPVVKDPQ
jgi:hypothetical protein